MNETAGVFLHREWPYLALALFAIGFTVRLLLTGDRVPSLKRALPRTQSVFLGGWVWRASWVALVAAHAIGLIFPRAIVAWTRDPWRLVALEAAGFAIGLAVLLACVRAAWLHLRRPARGGWSLLADTSDAAFITLLLVGVGSGLLAAALHRWGSEWAAVTVAPYAASLAHGRPTPGFVEHLPVLVRLHLFTAFAAIAIFPATRLALIPLALAHRAFAAAGRAVAAAGKPVRAWMGRKIAPALWPDAEVRWVVRPPVEVGPRPAGRAQGPWWHQLRGDGATLKQPRNKAV
jgi:nitrate reductase gamma subunit